MLKNVYVNIVLKHILCENVKTLKPLFMKLQRKNYIRYE